MRAIPAFLILFSLTLVAAESQKKAPPGPPCVQKEFKTNMVRTACANGGQPAAKDVMTSFCKDKQIKSCNQCHTTLAPKYDLKNDALIQFKKYGGS